MNPQPDENGVLILPEGTEVVLEESYQERLDLRELILPDSLETIGPVAFCGCAALERVRFGSGLKEIGDGAFLGTAALTAVSFPEGLERIGDMAFWESGLVRADLPASVTRIGESAFWDCGALERVTVPAEQAVLGHDCFGGCPSLREGYVAPGFPDEDYGPSNLLFSLLWATCPERHREAACRRAEAFIRENGELIIENLLKNDNAAALRGILSRELLTGALLDLGIRRCAETGRTELGAMFLSARGKRSRAAEDVLEEFTL